MVVLRAFSGVSPVSPRTPATVMGISDNDYLKVQAEKTFGWLTDLIESVIKLLELHLQYR